jgi:hypothetical protein
MADSVKMPLLQLPNCQRSKLASHRIHKDTVQLAPVTIYRPDILTGSICRACLLDKTNQCEWTEAGKAESIPPGIGCLTSL